jgi:iron complex transport system ATP-binding protein
MILHGPQSGSQGRRVSLAARDVTFAYGKAEILKQVSAAISPGRLTALVGPNGSGKSTLLAALARFITPSGGVVELDGEPILSQASRAVARKLAILPQSPPMPEGITVFELVSRGRFPHSGLLGLWCEADLVAIDGAMAMTGVKDFADRPVSGLSGGQRQRAWIAMALAQETPILLLDEPTSALDLRYQLEILALLRDLCRHHGRTVVIALHDLNLAAAHADEMIFFRQGKVHGAGATADICTAAVIEAVFDIAVDVLNDPRTGRPVFVPRLPSEMGAGEGGADG